MSWPSALLPESVIFGLIAAVSGGVLGGAIGRARAPSRDGVQVMSGLSRGRGGRARRGPRAAAPEGGESGGGEGRPADGSFDM